MIYSLMSDNNHQPQVASTSGASQPSELMTLRKTGRKVFFYLNKLCGENGDGTCTVSFPAIAAACDISERQAQISVGRLINAGTLERTSVLECSMNKTASSLIKKLSTLKRLDR